MKQNTLKYIIAFAIIVVIGIFAVQSVILKSRFDLSEKQFNESTQIALKEVTWQLLEYNKSYYGQSADFESLEPIERVSNDYYIVNVNDIIDGEVLKFHLIEEFKKHGINTDFEFAVYDCDSDSMKYGAYICADADTCKQIKSYNLPKSDKYTYYFGVLFPKRSQYFNSRMKGSYIFTILLMIVVLFFGYTFYIIIKQRKLSEVQKNFINNLTHELKTPISAIGLSSRVLNDPKIIESPERLLKYAAIIEEQNQRLSKNVEKVLSLASLEKNKIQLNPEEINLNVFVENIIDQFKHTSNGVKSQVSFTPLAVNETVFADKFHITHVFFNILENAVKYCEKVPEISVRIEKQTKNIFIIFEDNGIGIPDYAKKKIFKKFYRVPTGNVHNVKGFGLGLDYVKKIIGAHNWNIKIKDNPEGGSIFSILIPSN
ncbi:MAG: HAMP domain-containing histidine kinase [Prolixibacteraceae bacterium]|nr:HAMP domain-containing histidine kinase [Prolixibacteraceae bacterium]MBN2774334.1 HAMP domain-containing histidine kinase [Prolixibacteraceae bacterium]